MGTDADDIIDLYERHACAWVSARLHEGHFYERGWLDRFCELVSPSGSVLDMGCGAGQPMSTYLIERGFAVTGVDSSKAMIAMFQARLPGQEALISDMRTLALKRGFHGILAWDSFFHLDHDNQRRMFPVFRAHAAPRAALMFTTGPTHGEAIGRLEGEPLCHASLDAAEYRQLLDSNDFDVVATVAADQTCGGRTVWLAQLR
jgi:trans-aconitate methyltransferase